MIRADFRSSGRYRNMAPHGGNAVLSVSSICGQIQTATSWIDDRGEGCAVCQVRGLEGKDDAGQGPALRRRKHGNTETSNANADEKVRVSTTSALGTIFRGLKRGSTSTGHVDQESKGREAKVPQAALFTGTEQNTSDSMV
jgi:hypothetical protein